MTDSKRPRRRVGAGIAMIAAALAATVGATPAVARTILFVGNSFTFGAGSAVQAYRPDRVTDFNRQGIGGVPALFATFARQAKLDWTVGLETQPGVDLATHLETRRALFTRRWDAVVLQGHSMLDAQRPGDPTRHVAAARAIAALLHAANRDVSVNLVSTWSRADQTYPARGAWAGKPITQMADDLAAANAQAVAADPAITATIPVGAAWNRAFRDGVADANPYDGIAFGKVDLWTYDQYHASAAGYYLEALTIFATVTGVDPRTLGIDEQAGRELGLDPNLVVRLQAIAAATTRPAAAG